VLWRKGCFGSDSEAGSRYAERLLTVVATCRQQGLNLVEFLVAAGEAALWGTAPPSLLPPGQSELNRYRAQFHPLPRLF
jgi:transposase